MTLGGNHLRYAQMEVDPSQKVEVCPNNTRQCSLKCGTVNMASKSAQHTLAILKETLNDITDICQKVKPIVNKSISSPLWRVTEKDGHILDLCERYTGLVEFLTKVTEDSDK